MAISITTKAEFASKVHNSKRGMMLLFHGNNPDHEILQGYEDLASKKCGKKYPVYTVNIDSLTLEPADVAKYQFGIRTICCTILRNDKVILKEVNPPKDKVSISIHC